MNISIDSPPPADKTRSIIYFTNISSSFLDYMMRVQKKRKFWRVCAINEQLRSHAGVFNINNNVLSRLLACLGKLKRLVTNIWILTVKNRKLRKFSLLPALLIHVSLQGKNLNRKYVLLDTICNNRILMITKCCILLQISGAA